MPILEDAKKTFEQLTGYGKPKRRDVVAFVRPRKPYLFPFKGDAAHSQQRQASADPLSDSRNPVESF